MKRNPASNAGFEYSRCSGEPAIKQACEAYWSGISTEWSSDPVTRAKSVDAYKRACEGGEVRACVGLARMYEAGYGTRWARRKTGDLFGRDTMNGAFSGPRGTPIGRLAHLRTACKHGAGDSCYQFSQCFAERDDTECAGFRPYPEVALRYRKLACHNGHQPACFQLATGAGDWPLVEPERSRDLLETGCKEGHAASCNELFYRDSEPWSGPGHMGSGRAWLERACRLNEHEACTFLALDSACASGDGRACLEAGRFFAAPLAGVKPDGTILDRFSPQSRMTQWYYPTKYQVAYSDAYTAPPTPYDADRPIHVDERRALAYFRSGCTAGDAVSCRYGAWQVSGNPESSDSDLADAAREVAKDCEAGVKAACLPKNILSCHAGDAQSCRDAQELLGKMQIGGSRRGELAVVGCRLGNPWLCRTIAGGYTGDRDHQLSGSCRKTALDSLPELFRKACLAGDAEACFEVWDAPPEFYPSAMKQLGLHEWVYPANGWNRKPLMRSSLVREARHRCRKGDATACAHAVQWSEGGGLEGFDITPEESEFSPGVSWQHAACEKGDRPSCEKLINPMFTRDRLEQKYATGRLCEMGDAQRCVNRDAPDSWTQKARAEWLEAGCRAGAPDYCWQRVRMSMEQYAKASRLPDPEPGMTDRACALGSRAGCIEAALRRACELGDTLLCAEIALGHEHDLPLAERACKANEPLGCYAQGLLVEAEADARHPSQSDLSTAPDAPARPLFEQACRGGVLWGCAHLKPSVCYGCIKLRKAVRDFNRANQSATPSK